MKRKDVTVVDETTGKKPGAFRRAWLAFRGANIDQARGYSASPVRAGYSDSGAIVTQGTAIKISTVYACVRLISDAIATLPLDVYRRRDSGRVLASGHPLYGVLHNQPNPRVTAVTFWQAFVSSMLLWGDGYAAVERLGGEVRRLTFLHPDRVQVQKVDGKWVTTFTDASGTPRIVADVFHVPAFTLDGMNGVSPVQAGANVFAASMNAENATGNAFANGMTQNVYYRTEKWLKEKQRKDFQEQIADTIRTGESPLLEGGIDVKSLGLKPDDAQLLESREFSVAEICRWFGVPPWMVGHTTNSTSWGTGIEQQMRGFLMFTLRPWLARIEQAILKDLVPDAEKPFVYAQFNVEGLLRGDSAARASFYSSAVQNGWMTRAEVREKENLPVKAGSDELTAGVNLAPLDKLGVTQEQSE